MLVDVHTHFYPPEYLRLLEEAAPQVKICTDRQGRRYLEWGGTRLPTLTRPMVDLQERAGGPAGARAPCCAASGHRPGTFPDQPERVRVPPCGGRTGSPAGQPRVRTDQGPLPGPLPRPRQRAPGDRGGTGGARLRRLRPGSGRSGGGHHGGLTAPGRSLVAALLGASEPAGAGGAPASHGRLGLPVAAGLQPGPPGGFSRGDHGDAGAAGLLGVFPTLPAGEGGGTARGWGPSVPACWAGWTGGTLRRRSAPHAASLPARSFKPRTSTP